MRLLKFNNEIVDIDESTAIGIDVQAYDISNLSRRVNVSNKFSIPKTAHNMRLTGFAGNVQSASQIVYDEFTAEYWINSVRFIQGAAYVTDVDDRINCYVYTKNSLFDNLKDLSFYEFQQLYVQWLYEKGFPSLDEPTTFTNFLTLLNNYLKIPYFKSNLDTVNMNLKDGTGDGGHFACNILSVFEWIEYYFDVDLGVGRSFDYNIFEDTVFRNMIVPLRNITVEGNMTSMYLNVKPCNFTPHDVQIYANEKTLYDFVSEIFKYFNCILDNNPYEIRRFDSIGNAPVVELSNFQSSYKFRPFLEGYNQVNYIKFKEIYDGGSEYLNSKKIICKNKNITSKENTVLEIDAFISRVISASDTAADLSEEESFNTFSFLLETDEFTKSVSFNGTVLSITTNAAEIYSLASEYLKIEDIAEYPKVYEVKKYFSFPEINNIKFFRRFFVRELNGYFYIKKIKGFNPEKSSEPVTLTLIKL